MEYNLFEFSESKTEARLASLQENLVDSKTNKIRSYSDFREKATKDIKKYNNAWLRSEYNLAIAVGQTSAQYHRYMSEKDTVTSFVKYQTVGDTNVRNAHQSLNGKVFNLSDKDAMDLWPPNGFGCRCEMLQHLKKDNEKVTRGAQGKALMYSDDNRFKGSQFDINRANLKQVFTKKQFYRDIKGLPEKLNQRTFDKYGLKPYSDFKDSLKSLKLDNTITKDNFQELFKSIKDKDYMGYKDYLGRKMVMTQKTFDNHTKGHYLNDNEQRHKLFPHIKDVLNNPDEVWFSEYDKINKFQTNYIKYYNNKVLIVNTKIENDEFRINTWFSLIEKEKSLKRKGLLIKKRKDLY